MRWLVPLPFLCRDVHLQEGGLYLSCHDAKGREIYLLWHNAESRATSVLGMVQGKIKMFIMGAVAAPSFQTSSSHATSLLGV